MEEYVKRKNVLEKLCSNCYNKISKSIICSCAERLDILSIPSEDVVPVEYGEWKEIDQTLTGFPWRYKCSVCGNEQEYKYIYCPNCGKKMIK